MKKVVFTIFTVLFGAVAIYALYSLIGYTVLELQYPVLRLGEETAFFGGNLILLCVAGAAFLVAGAAFAVFLWLLIRQRRAHAAAKEDAEKGQDEEEKAA